MPAATNSTRAPGIGLLADAHLERRDGDKDTVVVERRPRKADAYERSPAPIPKQHKPEAAKQVWRDDMKPLMKHNFTPEEKRERLFEGRERPGERAQGAGIQERAHR